MSAVFGAQLRQNILDMGLVVSSLIARRTEIVLFAYPAATNPEDLDLPSRQRDIGRCIAISAATSG